VHFEVYPSLDDATTASDLHAGSCLLPIQNPPLFFTIPHYMFPIWQVELLLENPLDVFFTLHPIQSAPISCPPEFFGFLGFSASSLKISSGFIDFSVYWLAST
jgi:hypothetical protein